MNTPAQLRPGQLYQGTKPVRDPLYRRFIKMLPCAVCLTQRGVDPCHTGPHGTGQKACDLSCVPLCRKHHDQFDADPYGFAERHKLDIAGLIQKFNEFYRTKIKREAA